MATIKEVRADDAADLLPLLHEVQALHIQAHPGIFRNDTSIEERTDFLRGFISRDAVTALACRSSDGTVVGYLIYEVQNQGGSTIKTAREVGLLHQIVVHESQRGKGIASRLGNEMKVRLRAIGISTLCAEHFAFNEASASFLRSLGMAPLRITMEGDL